MCKNTKLPSTGILANAFAGEIVCDFRSYLLLRFSSSDAKLLASHAGAGGGTFRFSVSNILAADGSLGIGGSMSLSSCMAAIEAIALASSPLSKEWSNAADMRSLKPIFLDKSIGGLLCTKSVTIGITNGLLTSTASAPL
jgi:hypothetical protein